MGIQANQMFQAAIRDDQYKLIYRLDYNSDTLYQELYDATDLDEMAADDLSGTGIPAEALLLAEVDRMWASEGYDPLNGCP